MYQYLTKTSGRWSHRRSIIIFEEEVALQMRNASNVPNVTMLFLLIIYTSFFLTQRTAIKCSIQLLLKDMMVQLVQYLSHEIIVIIISGHLTNPSSVLYPQIGTIFTCGWKSDSLFICSLILCSRGVKHATHMVTFIVEFAFPKCVKLKICHTQEGRQ